MKAEDTEKLLSFKNGMQELIREWYEGCPKPLQLVSKMLKLYKDHFGNDYASS